VNTTFVDEKEHESDTSKSTDFEPLDSQSRFNLIDCSDSFGAISVGYGGVLLAGVVAEQQDLLAVEGVFRPGDVRQRTGSAGTAWVVGVMMVDEIDWCNSHQRLESLKRKEESVHTKGIRADVVASETVVLGKFAGMKGAKIEEVLHALPH